jgi:histidyl-tRNA synthetase
MADKLPTSPVRGTRDLLPAECALRDEALAAILRTYRSWGFARIETPALEHLELLAGGQGGENEKLIFKLLKRGEKLTEALAGQDGVPPTEDELADCGLRFDLTVPLARYYAEHQAELPLPFKAIQVGPVWRAERPQKGRYRQFTQCDIDVIGEPGAQAEIELILATTEALAAVGLSGFTVRINDRRFLLAFAAHCDVNAPADQERLFIALDKLDKLGLDGVIAELEEQQLRGRLMRPHLELLGKASAEDDPLARFEPMAWACRLARRRCAASRRARGPRWDRAARVAVDFTLVRGMGYYTGPIFEISAEGSPGSLAGGGPLRQDDRPRARPRGAGLRLLDRLRAPAARARRAGLEAVRRQPPRRARLRRRGGPARRGAAARGRSARRRRGDHALRAEEEGRQAARRPRGAGLRDREPGAARRRRE